DACHEDVAGRLRVFLIETDRTLVDSHLALVSLGCPGSFYLVAESPCRHSMSLSRNRASQILRETSRLQKSQFRGRNDRDPLRFVSSGAQWTKRRNASFGLRFSAIRMSGWQG